MTAPDDKDGTARDWKEDFAQENGNYSNTCLVCSHHFVGYKRRTVCKLCAVPKCGTRDEAMKLADTSLMNEAAAKEQLAEVTPTIGGLTNRVVMAALHFARRHTEGATYQAFSDAHMELINACNALRAAWDAAARRLK